MRTRSAAAPSASIDLADLGDAPAARSTGCSPITTRSAAASAGRRSTRDRSRDELIAIAPQILPLCRRRPGGSSTRRGATGKRILFEGAQGALLDIDHGTYPFVTSSNTVAGQAAAGSGLGPGAIGYVLGITKAYTTRVGEGPFPTEDKGEVGEFLGARGHEFGTVTGRKRRCGWFDAVLVRQTVQTSGIDGIALTKLDVLDGLEEIKIAVGYRLDGQAIDHLPAAEGAGAGRAGLRDDGRLAEIRPQGRAPGMICPRRRSSMSAMSRN